jgi:hypothetical protein
LQAQLSKLSDTTDLFGFCGVIEMSKQATAFALADVEWEVVTRVNIEIDVVSELFADTTGYRVNMVHDLFTTRAFAA